MNKGYLLKQCLLTIVALLTACSALLAQPEPRDVKRKADRFYEEGFYYEALVRYLQYEPNEPSSMDLKKRIGISYFHSNQLAQAFRYLEYIYDTEGESTDPEAILYLARVYHHQSNWRQAVFFYKEYLRIASGSETERAVIKDAILRCSVGLQLSGIQTQTIVENLGQQVNTTGDDFRPVLSPNYSDRLYFSSSRETSLGGRRNLEGEEDAYGEFPSDMYSTSVYNGAWTKANPLSYLLNSPRYESVLDFSQDGTQLYYFKGYGLYAGEVYVDTFRTRTEDRSLFSTPFQSPMAFQEGDTEPSWFQDTIVLFASRREGGFGGLDLYITVYRDGAWTDPQNLGPNINSKYDETAPFLSLDGRTLYFSSNHPARSQGGYDILRSFYIDRLEEWKEPENLLAPINSPGNDLHFRLSKDGLKGYFTSDRKSGLGRRDIYMAYFREPLEEQSNRSEPMAFVQVPEFRAQRGDAIGNDAPTGEDFAVGEVKQYYLDPLFYESDGEVLSARNNRTLRLLGQMLVEYPQLQLVLVGHSDNSDPEKFDQFFSVKRAEQVAEYLIGNGVPEGNIIVKAVGSAYPMANNETNGNPNPVGQRLNRRIDFHVIHSPEIPVRLEMRVPNVSNVMANPAYNYYQGAVKGLSYKVQISAQRQMYQGDALLRYPHAMIEKEPGSDMYLYTVGLYQTYNSVEQLRKDLEANGFVDAFIVPYINGVRVSPADVQNFTNAYPDLENYSNR